MRAGGTVYIRTNVSMLTIQTKANLTSTFLSYDDKMACSCSFLSSDSNVDQYFKNWIRQFNRLTLNRFSL